MQSMVLEVLITFGLCVVAEAGFLIADSFDCRQRKPRNGEIKKAPTPDPLGIAAR